MENKNEKNREIVTATIDWCKANAGKLIGGVALGGGIAADVVRRKKHKAMMADDSGNIVEQEIDTLDDEGYPLDENGNRIEE